MKKKLMIMMVLMIFSTTLFAKADKNLVYEYLKVSGAGSIILALPKQIEQGYLKNNKNASMLKDTFDAYKAIKYATSKLSHEFTDAGLKRTIEYYKSPLGKKFKKSGFLSMKNSNKKDKIAFFKELKNNPPSYERLNVMNAFVDKLELTPMAVHLIGERLGAINAELEMTPNSQKVLNSISDQIKEEMLANAMYAYKDFSDDELKAVMNYCYTNAGRFEQLIVSGVFKQLIQESFAQIIDQNRPQLAINSSE
jgi:hypothetical protein